MTNRGGANPRYANGSRRRALAKRVKAMCAPCWMCGLPIDATRKAGDPLAFELDELVPVSKGGSPTDPANVAGAHRCCNQWRGNRSVAQVETVRAEARRRFGAWRSPQEFVEAAKAARSSCKAPVRHPKRSSGSL